jgi:SH3 domain-containing YSC84-like protein 1
MKRTNTRLAAALLAFGFAFSAHARSEEKLEKKANDAAVILQESVAVPETSIPDSLMKKSTCIVTIPNVFRVGMGWGARFGKGVASCRVANGWSQPAFINIRGGSWGAQIGAQSVDLVLVMINPDAVEILSRGTFTAGVDASITAGPVGRDAEAGTDYKLDSAIYSYSKAHGLFAGLALQGSTLTDDPKDNAKMYGEEVAVNTLLTTSGDRSPATLKAYVDALNTYAH